MENKINATEEVDSLVKRSLKCLDAYANYTQEQIDYIVAKASVAALDKHGILALHAVEETKRGVFEDKATKNLFACEYVVNNMRHLKTVGVISDNEVTGITEIAEPVGVVAGITPVTNPTSTAIFKSLICLKTRNPIIFAFHPNAQKCSAEAAKIVYEAAVAAGAPKDCILWIEHPSMEATTALMNHPGVSTILATGGNAMVKAAYSCGKPALGVGAGNVPAYMEKTCNIRQAVNDIVMSKSFDNGMICASEQAVIIDKEIYDEAISLFKQFGCYLCNEDEKKKLISYMFGVNNESEYEKAVLKPIIAGMSAVSIAKNAGLNVPSNTNILLVSCNEVGVMEPMSKEKLSPVLAVYKSNSTDDGLEISKKMVEFNGLGHSAAIHTASKELATRFGDIIPAIRIIWNSPSTFGGIGNVYNSFLPSLTLGCGSYGGNSVSENVGVKHLLNVKTVAERRENMLWFRAPEKVYFKKGCLPVALDELKNYYHKTKAFIVTDTFLYQNGHTRPITDKLDEMGIPYDCFFEVTPDPTLQCAQRGLEQLKAFGPDVIIALGGGSAMDCAKIMWMMYEHPECAFEDLAMDFMDIRKRVYTFPKMGEKAMMVSIPTSSGTGSEVTPFAIITDATTGTKWPIADYELLPDMAIIDADFMMSQPKGLTSASGIDALTHALEAYVSIMATDFTDGMALKAAKIIFDYLPSAYDKGAADPIAREKMGNASTLAGMAFANAFLGVCHSMAHKLGAYHHLPHGIANALLIELVMRYNADPAPVKMGTFSQYPYPHAKERYCEVARFVGVTGKNDDEVFENFIKAIAELKEKVGIKRTIKDYGIEESAFLATLDEMVENAFNDQCTGANPRYPLMSEIKDMYLKAYYGE